ncbi:hypothetical protein B296_00024439 [Ensete ventricosum]|uniref:Uncharacterized protein n=1 Tax=Ensete ventricosum TaxID=4639 RepID=A0A426YND6_ENSVE|nr:hypothetical protein B296_00024439 [Ensete ventricosum]
MYSQLHCPCHLPPDVEMVINRRGARGAAHAGEAPLWKWERMGNRVVGERLLVLTRSVEMGRRSCEMELYGFAIELRLVCLNSAV